MNRVDISHKAISTEGPCTVDGPNTVTLSPASAGTDVGSYGILNHCSPLRIQLL